MFLLLIVSTCSFYLKLRFGTLRDGNDPEEGERWREMNRETYNSDVLRPMQHHSHNLRASLLHLPCCGCPITGILSN